MGGKIQQIDFAFLLGVSPGADFWLVSLLSSSSTLSWAFRCIHSFSKYVSPHHMFLVAREYCEDSIQEPLQLWYFIEHTGSSPCIGADRWACSLCLPPSTCFYFLLQSLHLLIMMLMLLVITKTFPWVPILCQTMWLNASHALAHLILRCFNFNLKDDKLWKGYWFTQDYIVS